MLCNGGAYGSLIGNREIPFVTKVHFCELDALIIAVPHDKIKEEFTISDLVRLMKQGAKLIFDLKAIYNTDVLQD